MNTEEKKLVENLLKAVKVLPEGERKYLAGYAEGVIAARKTVPLPEQAQAERESA